MKTLMIVACAAVSLAAPALAKDKDPVFVVAAPVKDKPGAAPITPKMAYILLRSDIAVPLYLMKLPSAEDQAAYDKMRATALVKARAKYTSRLKSYQAAIKANAAAGAGGVKQALPEKPVEPTEANFEFTPFPLLAAVAIGPINRFAKGDGGLSMYLHEVTPGDYRIYGPIMVAGNGAMTGTCFCMGSVAFTADAGQVVDLGVIAAKANAPGKRPDGDSSAPMLQDGQFLVPAAPGTALDPRLSSAKVLPARFRPIGKLPNYFGMTISRMPAMPNVMRYDRDRIVDLTAGN